MVGPPAWGRDRWARATWNPWGSNRSKMVDSPQLWPWLLVITGYFHWILHSINGVLSVLITGITRAITATNIPYIPLHLQKNWTNWTSIQVAAVLERWLKLGQTMGGQCARAVRVTCWDGKSPIGNVMDEHDEQPLLLRYPIFKRSHVRICKVSKVCTCLISFSGHNAEHQEPCGWKSLYSISGISKNIQEKYLRLTIQYFQAAIFQIFGADHHVYPFLADDFPNHPTTGGVHDQRLWPFLCIGLCL